MEEWRPCPDFEEKYEVSNTGHIRNKKTMKTLKPCYNQKRAQVNLTIQGKVQVSVLLHQLIARAFIPNPNNYQVIDHISRDTTDNSVTNLRWVTQAMNCGNKLGTVYKSGPGWDACVRKDGIKHRKYFPKDQYNEALEWREAKHREIFGELSPY